MVEVVEAVSTVNKSYLKPNPGEITTPAGQIVGEHAGLMYHTIGQRQGLGIGGVKNALAEPWFVTVTPRSIRRVK